MWMGPACARKHGHVPAVKEALAKLKAFETFRQDLEHQNGEPYHVHLVPLKGVTPEGLPVGGLDIPENVDVIPAWLHCSLRNRVSVPRFMHPH